MKNGEWMTIIDADVASGGSVREALRYKDLITMFVKRYFASMYKQTILGPLWIVINPLLSTVVLTVVFGNVAQLSTDGLPKFLFYMLGNTVWLLLSTTFTQNSTTFTSNAGVFGKVYFPRLTVPIATAIQCIMNFGVQFSFFLAFLIARLAGGFHVDYDWRLALLPVLIVLVALIGTGLGIIVSSLTTKYRDLAVLVSFATQLWMYATPIVYPWSELGGNMKWIIMLNPISPIVEAFRSILLGSGNFSWGWLAYSAAFAALACWVGAKIFHRIDRTFVDTV